MSEQRTAGEQRDPRVDPKIGYTISRRIPQAKCGVILRDVLRSHGGFVLYRQDNGYSAKYRFVSINGWRSWAEKAEVCDVAD